MLISSFVVALTTLSIALSPAPSPSTLANVYPAQAYALAQLQSARIAAQTDHEQAAYAEAARIQAAIDAELQAARLAELEREAQRQVTQAVVARTVSTPAPAAPAPTTQRYTSELSGWIAASDWPAAQHQNVYRVAMCESGGNPGAISPTGYVGLMQVAPWYHGYPPANPIDQLNQAYRVWLKQGWGAWECY